uniref:Origin recognition complex subunit 1 n=1 Tax=Macrostomum lignano TaxID=282301 RepID=A0A1I8FEQ0_9PLAT
MDPPPPPPRGQQRPSVLYAAGQCQRAEAADLRSAAFQPAEFSRISMRASAPLAHLLNSRVAEQRTPRKPPPLKCPLPPSPELTPPPVPPMPPKSTVGASDTPRRSVARKTPGFYAEQPTSPRPLHQAATDLDDDPDVDEDFEPCRRGSDDSEDSDETDDDIDGEEDLDDLEDDVASVDSMPTSPWLATCWLGRLALRQIAPGRRMSRASPLPASPLLRDSDIRLPNRRGAGNRRSTAPMTRRAKRLQAREAPRICPADMTNSKAVFSFVESRLRQERLRLRCGCLFIRRVPAPAKTATVMEVLRQVADMPDLPPFDTVSVYPIPTGPRPLADSPPPAQVGVQQRQRASLLLLVDELDMLNPNSRLIVLAIANTMDLPERVLVHRVASRLGLSRLPRPADGDCALPHLQVLHIFEDKAVEMAARKVAAVSGDARTRPDLCSRSCDLAEQEFGPQQMQRMNLQVGMKHGNAAIAEMFAGGDSQLWPTSLASTNGSPCGACLSQRLESGRDENRLAGSGAQCSTSPDRTRPGGGQLAALCVCLGCLHAMRLLLWDGGTGPGWSVIHQTARLRTCSSGCGD